MTDNDSPIVLTREGKDWLAADTMSGVSSFGDSETEAYRMLAEALALYLDGVFPSTARLEAMDEGGRE